MEKWKNEISENISQKFHDHWKIELDLSTFRWNVRTAK